MFKFSRKGSSVGLSGGVVCRLSSLEDRARAAVEIGEDEEDGE